jgi:hypothetical protein
MQHSGSDPADDSHAAGAQGANVASFLHEFEQRGGLAGARV